MAIAKLDANKKVVLSSNSAQMDYVTKADEKKLVAIKTAAARVVEDVAQLKEMGVDKVNVSFQLKNMEDEKPHYQTYWANIQKNGNVNLKPVDSKVQDTSDMVFFKKVEKDGKHFYTLIDSSNTAGEIFAKSLITNNWPDKDGNEHTSLKARVNILDKDLQKALVEKGEGAFAIISKGGMEVTTKQELEAKKAAEQEKDSPSKSKKKDNDR